MKPKPPPGCTAVGRRLWNAVLDEYELDTHEVAVLREAVRTVDQIEQLQAVVKDDGPMQNSPQAGACILPSPNSGSSASCWLVCSLP